MLRIHAKIRSLLLQLKGRIIFGKKVGILGSFTVEIPRNVSIGEDCGINSGVYILGHSRIEIGSRVVLSARCMLIDSGLDTARFGIDAFPPHIKSYVVIEDDVWIGAGAIILPCVTVGRKSIVGAGSVVTKDVPPFTIVAGNPAREIGKIDA